MNLLIKIGLFFWRNPWAAITLLSASVYGVIHYQGWRIDGLKLVNKQLEQTIKTERRHNEKVINAFESKRIADEDTENFRREAKIGILAAPDPVLDAYRRVYERHNSATAKRP